MKINIEKQLDSERYIEIGIGYFTVSHRIYGEPGAMKYLFRDAASPEITAVLARIEAGADELIALILREEIK